MNANPPPAATARASGSMRPLDQILIVLACAMAAATFVMPRWRPELIASGTYYISWAVFIVWMTALNRARKAAAFDVVRFFKGHRAAVAAAAVLTVVVFGSVRPEFRVFSDETNLASVSMSMVYRHKAEIMTSGKYYYDIFLPMDRTYTRQGTFFPFLAHLIHVTTGYRPENLFLLNAIALFLLYLAVYVFMEPFCGRAGATTALILLTSHPAIVLSAASGGAEIFALLCLFLLFVWGRRHLEHPTDASLGLLIATILVIVNTRYQWGYPMAVVSAALYVFGQPKEEAGAGRWAARVCAAAPLALLPLLWAEVVGKGDVMTALTVSFDAGKGAWRHASAHAASLISALFGPVSGSAFDALVNLVGLAFALSLIGPFISGRIMRMPHQRRLVMIALAAIAVDAVILVGFGSSFSQMTFARQALIHPLALTLIAVYGLSKKHVFLRAPALALVASVALCFVYGQAVVRGPVAEPSVAQREYDFIDGFLKTAADANKRFIAIVPRPNQYVINAVGVAGFEYANAYANVAREFHKKLYEQVYVAQRVDPGTGKTDAQTALDSRYVLEPIDAVQISPTVEIVMSKVVRAEEAGALRANPDFAPPISRLQKLAAFLRPNERQVRMRKRAAADAANAPESEDKGR